MVARAVAVVLVVVLVVGYSGRRSSIGKSIPKVKSALDKDKRARTRLREDEATSVPWEFPEYRGFVGFAGSRKWSPMMHPIRSLWGVRQCFWKGSSFLWHLSGCPGMGRCFNEAVQAVFHVFLRVQGIRGFEFGVQDFGFRDCQFEPFRLGFGVLVGTSPGSRSVLTRQYTLGLAASSH